MTAGKVLIGFGKDCMVIRRLNDDGHDDQWILLTGEEIVEVFRQFGDMLRRYSNVKE